MSDTALASRTTTSSPWRIGGIVAAASLVANLILWAVAEVGGASLDVTQAGDTVHVGLGTVALMTVLPLALGTLLLWGTRSRAPRAWRLLAWVGLAVGVVTVVMPFTVEATTGTQLVLAAMHLVVGGAWFAAISRTLRG